VFDYGDNYWEFWGESLWCSGSLDDYSDFFCA